MQPITRINYNDFLRQLHVDYVMEFEKTFDISGNATIRCTNAHIPAYHEFIENWTGYFRENDMLLGHLLLEIAGTSANSAFCDLTN